MLINPYAFDNNFGPPGFDFFYADTVMLAGFNGTDTATSYSDESAAGHGAFTFGGTAQLDTAIVMFGSAALLLDGNSDFVSLPDNADWHILASQPFTIEAWVYPDASGAAGTILAHYNATTNRRNFNFNRGTTDLLTFNWSQNGTSLLGPIISTDTIDQDTWSHVAVTRNASGLVTLWVNGVGQGDTASDNNAWHDSNATLRIGTTDNGVNFWPGSIDDIRFTQGVCRYDVDFTPTRFPTIGP